MMANVVILTETFRFIEQSVQIIAQQWAASLNTNVVFSCKGEAAPFAESLVLSFATYSLNLDCYDLNTAYKYCPESTWNWSLYAILLLLVVCVFFLNCCLYLYLSISFHIFLAW